MDRKTRHKFELELQARIRPMTGEEIAAKQAREGPSMRNNLEAMRGGQGVQNYWTHGDEPQYDNRLDQPAKPAKRSIFQSLMAWIKA